MTQIAKSATSRGRDARPTAPSALASHDAEPPGNAARRVTRREGDSPFRVPVQPSVASSGGRVSQKTGVATTSSPEQRIRRGNTPAKVSKADTLPVVAMPVVAPKRTSKQATIIALIQRTRGATLADLIAATGWQQHSLRAALTGLRKAGHSVERQRDDAGETRYRLVVAA